jgi:hypothetical protein
MITIRIKNRKVLRWGREIVRKGEKIGSRRKNMHNIDHFLTNLETTYMMLTLPPV